MDPVSRLANRLFPDSRVRWDSSNGTAIRDGKGGYKAKPQVVKVKRLLTEAEDNARGKAQSPCPTSGALRCAPGRCSALLAG